MSHLRNINVLIFPAGSEIAIEIFDALKFQKDVTVFGATSVEDHAEFLFSKLHKGLPFFTQSGFIEALNKVVDEDEIEFIYPARDDVQLFLTEHQNELHARVVSSDLHTVEICRSKKKTYELFAGDSFIPKTFQPSEIEAFPVFGKPAVGEGAKGAVVVNSKNELEACLESSSEYVFCEYLPGDEYTVDCFTDAQGNLRVAKARVRDRIRTGISVRSHLVNDNEEAVAIARTINARLSFSGAWYFQVKQRESGELILMEISPRIPGTMGLSRNCGINFPLLSLYALKGWDLDIFDLGFDITLDKAFVSRFKVGIEYHTVYIDYDDTICFKGKVNAVALQYLYQCRNAGKRIILLTKHCGDIAEELDRRCIAYNLFDEVVHLDKGESKASYVTESSAIFIDDSFSERRAVYNAHGIPVFDLGNLEALLDWRM